jgi:hypothetical protein
MRRERRSCRSVSNRIEEAIRDSHTWGTSRRSQYMHIPKGGEKMKKLTYVKPKVVGSANVHPC